MRTGFRADLRRVPRLLAALLPLAVGCEPRTGNPPPAADSAPAASAEPAFLDPATVDVGGYQIFHRGVRAMELAGDSQPDSVVLTAYGDRGDSLVVRMDFFVDGERAFRRSWWSSDELIDQDSVRADAGLMRSFLIAKFDQELSSVSLEPIDVETIETMSNDPEAYARISPPPENQVAFGYGYETVVALAFDPEAHRFVVVWECC